MGQLLTLDEELELGASIANGCDEALAILVKSNLAYVHKLAYRFRYGQELEELVAAGYLGLVKAARSYDHTRGNRFLSYAHFLIVKEIIAVISAGRFQPHVPHWIRNNSTKLTKASEALRHRLHREPTDQELSDEMGLPVERVVELKLVMMSVIELDRPFVDGDATPLDVLIQSEKEDTTVDPMIIKRLLSVVTKRQQRVVRAYLGIGCEPQTFQEIGNDLGVSRMRAFQIYHLAIERMKTSSVAQEVQR